MTSEVDVLIIGAGPIGLACGIEAQRASKTHVIIDKGCLVNSIYNYPKNMTFFSTSDKLEIGDVPFVSHNPKPVRSEALEYYRRAAEHWKLNVRLYERVEHVIKEGALHKITTSKGTYKAKAIVIATGFYDLPYNLDVSGEHLDKVKHYYDEPHPYYAMDVAVIGAANSAVDVALETFRKGAKSVTMIVRNKAINPRVKYWVLPDIENRIKEGSIKAYFESTISEIREREIDIQSADGLITIPNDFVLAMTGYQPDFSFLEKLGVKIGEDQNKTPVYNTETMETNVANIFLAGVICGGLKTNAWFIENSRIHAQMIMKTLEERD